MDEKLKILLDGISFDKDHYNYFSDAKIDRMCLYKSIDSLEIYLSLPKNIDIDYIIELDEKIINLDKNLKDIKIFYEVNEIDINMYLKYFPYVLKKIKDKVRTTNMFTSNLTIENDLLVLVARNNFEETLLNEIKPDINEIYQRLGYKENIDIKVLIDDLKEQIEKEKQAVEEIVAPKEEKKVEEKTKKFPTRRKKKDENTILGIDIKDSPIRIKNVIAEDNNITIEGEVFGTELFEPKSGDFKIITLKVTDYSDSIYCKIFTRDEEDSKRVLKEVKESHWYRMRGYTKIDKYSNNEIVLNVRDILEIEAKTNPDIKEVFSVDSNKLDEIKMLMEDYSYDKLKKIFSFLN